MNSSEAIEVSKFSSNLDSDLQNLLPTSSTKIWKNFVHQTVSSKDQKTRHDTKQCSL